MKLNPEDRFEMKSVVVVDRMLYIYDKTSDLVYKHKLFLSKAELNCILQKRTGAYILSFKKKGYQEIIVAIRGLQETSRFVTMLVDHVGNLNVTSKASKLGGLKVDPNAKSRMELEIIL